MSSSLSFVQNLDLSQMMAIEINGKRILLIAIELILFGSFIWALVWWFQKTLVVKRWELTFIKVSGIVFVLAHLLAATFSVLPSPVIYWIGVGLLLLSALIFFWSLSVYQSPPAVAFAVENLTALNTKGPYQFIRHPFYTSYLIAWFAGSLASGCYYLLATCAIMLFIYHRAAKEEEALWLSGKDADTYKDYITKAGMFLPRL